MLLEDVCYPIGVIWKQQIDAKSVLTSVTVIFDLWLWPFAWTSFLNYISHGRNWLRCCPKVHTALPCGTTIREELHPRERWRSVTDRQTDRQTGRHRVLIELLVAVKNTKGHGLYNTLSGLKNPEKLDKWGLSHITTLWLCWGQGILKNKEYRFIEVCIERAHSKNMHTIQNKANLRNLVAATGQVILLKLDSNRRFFSPCDLEITLNSGQNLQFFVPCDLEIWRMTLKNNRATFLYCFKLCASFHSHQWIRSGVTVRKRGSKYRTIFWHQFCFSFIFTWEDVTIKIMLMISWVSMMLSFCSTHAFINIMYI